MRRHHGFGLVPFALITAALLVLGACHVVDDGDGRRCRSAGQDVELVAAVDGRGGGGGGRGGGGRGGSFRGGSGGAGTVKRPAPGGGPVDGTRKRRPVPAPAPGDLLRKDTVPAPSWTSPVRDCT